MADLSKMSDEELEALAGGGKPQKDLSKMSDAELERIASGKAPSKGEDVLTLAEKHVSLGLAPLMRGIGGYIGAGYGDFERDEGHKLSAWDQLKSIPGRMAEAHAAGSKEFSRARQEQIDAEADASARNPGINASMGLGTAVLTAPHTAVRGATALGRIGWGIGSGAGQAALRSAGHANSLGEAATDIGTGAVLGGAIPGASEVVKGGANMYRAIPEVAKDLAKDMAKKAVASTAGFSLGGPMGAVAAAVMTPTRQAFMEKTAQMTAKFGAPQLGSSYAQKTAEVLAGPAAKPFLGGTTATSPELAKGFMTYMANDIAGTSSALDRRRQKLQGR